MTLLGLTAGRWPRKFVGGEVLYGHDHQAVHIRKALAAADVDPVLIFLWFLTLNWSPGGDVRLFMKAWRSGLGSVIVQNVKGGL